MESPDISVYGEAKGEYTRQLCVFLVPALETYILSLLEEAKVQAPSPQKVLWQFQTLLQGIPDWNQDKVLKETGKIQNDCNCDYLEELLTAVFIAHTKVLSAIRLTTRQKKLQITIPKMDHFIHRLLSESARSLWTNAYLFADTNAIEKQKNFRQVSSLLNDSVLQAIRGLLPVKSILREYLHDEEGEIDAEEERKESSVEEVVSAAQSEEREPVVGGGEEKEDKSSSSEVHEEGHEIAPVIEQPLSVIQPTAEEALPAPPAPAPSAPAPSAPAPSAPSPSVTAPADALPSATSAPLAPAPLPPSLPPASLPLPVAPLASPPIINVDTKPSVTFSQDHVFFDSDNLEANEIQEIPFAEDEDMLTINNEILPMEADTL